MASTYQTLTDVYADVRFAVSKDSTTLPDAQLLRLANKYYALLIRELIDLNEDLYAEIGSTDLVANQREYPLPADSASTYGGGLIKLQRVEVSYNGSMWYVAHPLSLQEIPGPTILDADLNLQFSSASPRYWFKDRSLWLAPVPSSTDSVAPGNANLRIYWIKRKNEMTSTADIPSIPKDFLNVLVEGMLGDVFRHFGRLTDMKIAENRWDTGIAKMREMEQSPDQEQQLVFKGARKNYT